MKILHFSDLHLETEFDVDGFSDGYGNWRRQQLRATLGRICALAETHKVDVITIGGDLFNNDFAVPETAQFLIQQFERIGHIKVLITPGSHDPITNDSLYALSYWPNNVWIFNENGLKPLDIGENIIIWGAACPASKNRNILQDCKLDKTKTNILLVHVNNIDSGNKQGFSIDEEQFIDSGFDLGLLGGKHDQAILPNPTPPFMIFPGSPEPLVEYSVAKEHHIALIEITPKEITTDLHNINEVTHKAISVNISNFDSISALINSLQDQYNKAQKEVKNLIITFYLDGVETFEINTTELDQALDLSTYVRFKSRTSSTFDLEKLSTEQTIRGVLAGRFLKKREEISDQDEQKLLDLAIKFALRSLDSEKVNLP